LANGSALLHRSFTNEDSEGSALLHHDVAPVDGLAGADDAATADIADVDGSAGCRPVTRRHLAGEHDSLRAGHWPAFDCPSINWDDIHMPSTCPYLPVRRPRGLGTGGTAD